MPRHTQSARGVILPTCSKTRKRGCSTSSSSSSVVHNYRFKKPILIARSRVGSRSSTPAPSWKLLMGGRSPGGSALRISGSPRHPPSQSGKPRPAPPVVSARKLAATLWEMNEMPSPRVLERVDEKRVMRKQMGARERAPARANSGSLPPHLSDPSHSPVSERMDRSGTGGHRRRESSFSQKLRQGDHNVGVYDSISSASYMEIETRSHCQTPCGSTVGGRNRLKDVSNALTTSKELLKIITRVWGPEDRPSSSMSLISALHAELERARLQVNQLIHEQRSDQNEINYLMKCFAEEKAAWKDKEREGIETAIESISGELEVERKLRRRFESLNKKLGKELAETKSSLLEAVKDLEDEKRFREIMEEVCKDLVGGDIRENEAKVELQKESTRFCEDLEKEREMLYFEDMLHEDRVPLKAEAKCKFNEKKATLDKLRKESEVYLRRKNVKEKVGSSVNLGNDRELAAYLERTHMGSHPFVREDDSGGEVDDRVVSEEESAESDLPPIELNMDDSKNNNWSYISGPTHDSRKLPANGVVGRKSAPGKASRSIQRSISDSADWVAKTDCCTKLGDGPDWGRAFEDKKLTVVKGHEENSQRHRSGRGLRDQVLSKLGSAMAFASPTRQWGQLSPSRDPVDALQERPSMVPFSGLKPRQIEAKGEGLNMRKSKHR